MCCLIACELVILVSAIEVLNMLVCDFGTAQCCKVPKSLADIHTNVINALNADSQEVTFHLWLSPKSYHLLLSAEYCY